MKKILLAFACTVLLLPATGQNIYNYTPVAPDKKNPQPAVQQPDSLKPEKRHFVTRIKLSPLLVFNGDFPVFVEQKLYKGLSAEVSAGVTYKNYISEMLETDYDAFFTDLERNSRKGYSFSAALRYYPIKEYGYGHGFYFSPEVRYREYNFRVYEFENEPFDLDQTKKLTDIKLKAGWLFYLDKHIVLDIFAGLGVRDKHFINKLEGEDKIVTSSSPPYNSKIVTVPIITNEKSVVPILAGGFKLGFSF